MSKTSVAVLAPPMRPSESAQSDGRDELNGNRPQGSKRRWWPGAICCVLYLAVSMIVFGHFGSLGAAHMTGTMSIDILEQVWWLAWTAFAVPHGHNVFSAQWQNYPAGENFGVNGSMLALGVLFMPITKIFGPIVTWNIALRLALAASAASMCFVLRRWVTWWPAAFVGGLLYGFSSYAFANAYGYLFLVFVPFPPVFFLLLHEILVRQRWRPQSVGVLLGVLCALQFFIWSEVLVGTVFMGAIATVLFLLVNRHRLEETWRRYAMKAVVSGGVVGALLLVIPGAYTLFGPQNTHGSPSSASAQALFPSDLLGSIVPPSKWLSSNGLTTFAGSHLTFSSAEYIGIPMIVVLVCFAFVFRKQKILLFAGTMAVISFILSLGSHLWIGGHRTPLPLPWAVLAHIPLLGGYVPVRFSLFTALFIAAMFSIGLDEVRRRLRAAERLSIWSPGQRAFAAAGASVAIAAAVVLPLVPAAAEPAQPANIPSFFTSAAVDAIPEGSVVLAYPYPDFTGLDLYFQTPHSIMLDQAASGMRFKLLGGYGWFPNPTGRGGTTNPPALHPESVQSLLDRAYWATPSAKETLSPPPTSSLRTVLKKYDVDAVVLQPQGSEPDAVVRYVTSTIGCPAYYPGLAVWLHVKQRLAEAVPGRDVNSCAIPPDVVPRPYLFRSGNGPVSGGVILAAKTTSYLKMTSVAYYLSGRSLHEKLIGRSSSPGYPVLWNTSTVPNGSYVLRSVGVSGAGWSKTSSGMAVTVKN